MTENLAARGEGLAGLVAKWEQRIESNFGPTDRLIGINQCLVELKALLALEAAAPPSTAPRQVTSDCIDQLREMLDRKDLSGADLYALNEAITALATPSAQAPQQESSFSTTSAREQSSATASVIPSVGDEVAWLIERGGLCLGFCEYKFAWVTFTNEEALRFSRRLDAYSFKETVKWAPFNLPMEGVTITEHMWCAPAGQLEKYERTHSRVWINAWNAAIEEVCGLVAVNGHSLDFGPFSIGHNPKRVCQEHTMIVELIRALKHPVPALRSSSVPVGEQPRCHGTFGPQKIQCILREGHTGVCELKEKT